MNVVVASESALKLEAVEACLTRFLISGSSYSIIGMKAICNNPEQPINSSLLCASRRVNALLSTCPPNTNIIISIENGIVVNEGKGTCYDVCTAVLFDMIMKRSWSNHSFPIPVPIKYYHQAKEASANVRDGLSVTIGECISKENPGIAKDNWMASPKFGGISRLDQITDALIPLLRMYVEDTMATY